MEAAVKRDAGESAEGRSGEAPAGGSGRSGAGSGVMGAFQRLSPLGKARVPSPKKPKKRRGRADGGNQQEPNDPAPPTRGAAAVFAHGSRDAANALGKGTVTALNAVATAAVSAPSKLLPIGGPWHTKTTESPKAEDQSEAPDIAASAAPLVALEEDATVRSGSRQGSKVPSEGGTADGTLSSTVASDLATVASRNVPPPLQAQAKDDDSSGPGVSSDAAAPLASTVGRAAAVPRAAVAALVHGAQGAASTAAEKAAEAVQAVVATRVTAVAAASRDVATRQHPSPSRTMPPVLTPSPVVVQTTGSELARTSAAMSGDEASKEAPCDPATPSGILDWLVRGPQEFWKHCFPESSITTRDKVVAQVRQIRRDLQRLRSLSYSPPNRLSGKVLDYNVRAAQEALNQILLFYVNGETESTPLSGSVDGATAIAGDEAPPSPSSVPRKAVQAVQKLVVDPVQRVLDRGAHSPKSDEAEPHPSFSSAAGSLPAPSPAKTVDPQPLLDRKLLSMTQMIKQTIPHATIRQLYETCISETTPFYGPWLESTGKTNVAVGPWETGSVVGDDDGEDSDHLPLRRAVTYELVRPGLAGTGDVTARVTQEQRCRWNDDELVWDVRVDTRGIPFGDTFHVEIRWVAVPSPNGSTAGIHVLVGVSVVFAKQTIVSSQIRASATSETGKLQLKLFQAVRQTLVAVDDTSARDALDADADADTDVETPPCDFLGCWLSSNRPTAEQDAERLRNLRSLETRMSAIEAFLPASSDAGLDFTLQQLDIASQSLRVVLE